MIRPKQKLSTTEKFKGSWIRDNGFYWSSMCKKAIDDQVADLLLRAANGELTEQDYTWVENPLNTDCEKFKKFPARIRNYDIINYIVMMLMGEKRKRGLRYTVVARNSDVASMREQVETEAIDRYLAQTFVNQYLAFQQQNQNAIQVDMEQVQTLSVEQIKKQAEKIPDRVASNGQSILDYIVDYNKLESRFAENWFYWIVLGRAFSFREPYRDEVIYTPVPPTEMYYMATSHTVNLEDAEAQKRRTKMPLTQIIDRFQGVDGFTQEVEDELEAKLGYGNGFGWNEITHHSEIDPGNAAFSEMWRRVRGQSNQIYSDEEGIPVEHVIWTSMVKIGRLTTTNIFGDIIHEEVDEDFKPMLGETVEWVWVQQKWQCWIIDDKHVVGGGPVLHCQGDYYRPDAVKGPYNGRILGMKGTNPKSIVEKGLPYQVKFNILHYYIEKIIAKNLDKIVVVPLSLIPEEEGLTIEAAMYYANAMNFLFVDDSNPKALQALNGLKVLDAQLSQGLNQLYQILSGVKMEWEESIGVTPARKGQMQASDGKAVTENAIFRSSIMTEEYFAQYEDYQESDLQYMMECSKFAFSEGKQSIYFDRDLKEAILAVTGEDVVYPYWAVRVSSSGKDMDELNAARNLAQAFAQNAEGRFTPAIKAIKSNNISQLIEEMEILEDEIQAQIQANEQANREAQMYVADQNRAIKESEMALEKYKIDQDNATKLRIKEMDSQIKLVSEFYNPEGGDADLAKFNELNMKRDVEMKKIQADQSKAVLDAQTKKYVADKQLQVAKENKSM